jgi:hypothetical protein
VKGGPRKYTIVLTFETERPLPMNHLQDVAQAAFAQLEGLTEDHGHPYRGATVEVKEDEKT